MITLGFAEVTVLALAIAGGSLFVWGVRTVNGRILILSTIPLAGAAALVFITVWGGRV